MGTGEDATSCSMTAWQAPDDYTAVAGMTLHKAPDGMAGADDGSASLQSEKRQNAA